MPDLAYAIQNPALPSRTIHDYTITILRPPSAFHTALSRHWNVQYSSTARLQLTMPLQDTTSQSLYRTELIHGSTVLLLYISELFRDQAFDNVTEHNFTKPIHSSSLPSRYVKVPDQTMRTCASALLTQLYPSITKLCLCHTFRFFA